MDLWGFQKVDDIKHFLTNVLMIYFTDLFSVIVTSAILWTICRINLFKAIWAIQKEFGLVMFISLGYMVLLVRENS